MKRKTIFATFATIFAAQALAADPPVPDNVPQSVAVRVYIRDTSQYDLIPVLGKLGVVDVASNTITHYIDRSHFRCDPAIAARTRVTAIPDSRAYYFLFTNKYSGSLSVFASNMEISDTQRQQVSIDDVATADLEAPCQIDTHRLAAIVRGMPAAAGRRIYYVTGATLSRFRRETFSETDAGGGISAGSWLSIDAKYYKGSNQMDSVPLISVRGYFIDVPERIRTLTSEQISALDLVARPFTSNLDLGLSASPNSQLQIVPQ